MCVCMHACVCVRVHVCRCGHAHMCDTHAKHGEQATSAMICLLVHGFVYSTPGGKSNQKCHVFVRKDPKHMHMRGGV